MAFRSIGVSESPLGKYIQMGLDRGQQNRSQEAQRAWQAGQNILSRGHQTRMQDDRQQAAEMMQEDAQTQEQTMQAGRERYGTRMDALQWGRGAPQREMQAELHGLQTEEMRGVRSSNILDDLIQQQSGGFAKSLFDPTQSNITMQDDKMTIPQQIKDFAGMTSMDMAQGLAKYMGEQNLDLDETQQRELQGKANLFFSGAGGKDFRKSLMGTMGRDVLLDTQTLGLDNEQDYYSDIWEKAMTPYTVGEGFNPFSSEGGFSRQLEFGSDEKEPIPNKIKKEQYGNDVYNLSNPYYFGG